MLYTVLMEYSGGTYVSQIVAGSADEALGLWVVGLNVPALTAEEKSELVAELSTSTNPAHLDGLVNAWCTSALISRGLVLINIIATAS